MYTTSQHLYQPSAHNADNADTEPTAEDEYIFSIGGPYIQASYDGKSIYKD